MKQKMIGVRLEGPPAVQSYQLGSQLAGAILIQMLTDVGRAPAARAMANLDDLLAGCVSEAQQTGVTLQ